MSSHVRADGIPLAERLTKSHALRQIGVSVRTHACSFRRYQRTKRKSVALKQTRRSTISISKVSPLVMRPCQDSCSFLLLAPRYVDPLLLQLDQHHALSTGDPSHRLCLAIRSSQHDIGGSLATIVRSRQPARRWRLLFQSPGGRNDL